MSAMNAKECPVNECHVKLCLKKFSVPNDVSNHILSFIKHKRQYKFRYQLAKDSPFTYTKTLTFDELYALLCDFYMTNSDVIYRTCHIFKLVRCKFVNKLIDKTDPTIVHKQKTRSYVTPVMFTWRNHTDDKNAIEQYMNKNNAFPIKLTSYDMTLINIVKSGTPYCKIWFA